MKYLFYVLTIIALLVVGCEKKEPCGPNGCPIKPDQDQSEPSSPERSE
jgi:hypothetical protein